MLDRSAALVERALAGAQGGRARSWSTSTASRRSTTATATPPATGCSRRSPSGWPRAAAAPTCSAASAARSSSRSSPTWRLAEADGDRRTPARGGGRHAGGRRGRGSAVGHDQRRARRPRRRRSRALRRAPLARRRRPLRREGAGAEPDRAGRSGLDGGGLHLVGDVLGVLVEVLGEHAARASSPARHRRPGRPRSRAGRAAPRRRRER